MYLDELAGIIRAHTPRDRLPEDGAEDLLRLYAVLLRAKGARVTQSDIHDAWSAWMAQRRTTHPSLIPYENLAEKVKREDQAFTTAVRLAADQVEHTVGSNPRFSEILFPSGPPAQSDDIHQALDLYKIMVQSSESLVSRRQGVNTFFLTINGAILTASGLIVQNSSADKLGTVGIAILALAGAMLAAAWKSLITSFGQLNRGKFRVINAIERHFKVAIYAAEWEALGRGENPKLYRSFTSREIWVPRLFLALYIVAFLVACSHIVVVWGAGVASVLDRMGLWRIVGC